MKYLVCAIFSVGCAFWLGNSAFPSGFDSVLGGIDIDDILSRAGSLIKNNGGTLILGSGNSFHIMNLVFY